MSIQDILAEIPSLSPQDLLRLKREVEERVQKTPLTIGDAAGDLLEGVDDLPGDLNSNPKYMEDFGK